MAKVGSIVPPGTERKIPENMTPFEAVFGRKPSEAVLQRWDEAMAIIADSEPHVGLAQKIGSCATNHTAGASNDRHVD